MKPVFFYIDNKKIEFEVSAMGLETLKIDGHQVSKKWSFPGAKHKFVLDAHGKTESFYIKTKQDFTSGNVTVQLFHNDVLIDEALTEFGLSIGDKIKNKSDNGMFLIGLIFVVLSLLFGWSKLFLFIGLIFLFSTFYQDSKEKDSTKKTSNTDSKD